MAARSALSEESARFSGRVEAFMGGLRSELVQARQEIAAHNRTHANGFNVFTYIKPNENRLSLILADLLDPKGAHGQGDAFLQVLAKQLGVTIPTGPGRVTVYREEMTTYITNSRRRIDILIDFGTFGIGIENKPWAEEMPNQVEDYFLHLGKRYSDNFLLIYLSGKGLSPPSVGVEELIRREEQNQFRLLAYRIGLVDWIRECIADCEADSVRWFLRDFLDYVVEEFAPPETDWRG